MRRALHPLRHPRPLIHFPDHPVDPVMPVHEALLTEEAILEDLYLLCRVASKHNDYTLEDAIVSRFLRKETKHVKDMGIRLQQCVRVSKQVGQRAYELDRELRACKGLVPWGMANEPDRAECLVGEVVKKDLKEACMLCKE
jgi:ferritin heavy chain